MPSASADTAIAVKPGRLRPIRVNQLRRRRTMSLFQRRTAALRLSAAILWILQEFLDDINFARRLEF
jgi:hypothetical protein